uniref:Uncharacterized protein n=1 Tax=Tanacetum cinerariifolium TaxID=118510 RepID=A0A6L2J1H8_TANCI|nr:hypothetical protein [Tanacetum cinerariifolium]
MSKLSEGQDSPLTKLRNTIVGKYKFIMKIPDTMINDVIKQSVGYKYYKHKRNESKKAKVAEEPEEQHVSPVKSEKGKVAVELAKSISIEEQRHLQRTIVTQLTIDQRIDKAVEDTYVEWGHKLKGHVVEDPAVQSLLDIQKGSKASRVESLEQSKQAVGREGLNSDEAKDDETSDYDNSDVDLSEEELKGDDDNVGFGVFMYNKSAKPLKSTYLNPTVTCSSSKTHDDLDHPNDREGVNMKQRKKDAGEPSSRSLRKDKSLVVQTQDNTPANHPRDQQDLYVQERHNVRWFMNKSGSPDKWSKEVHRYHIEALNGIHHWEDARQDFFKVEINNRSPGKVYYGKRIISVVRVDVKRK